MEKYTIVEYKKMSERFNQKTSREKIETIRNNKDILTLASDGKILCLD